MKIKNSLPLRLSIRFMIVVAVIVLLLSSGFVFSLRFSITNRMKNTLMDLTDQVCLNLTQRTPPEVLGLPYFLTYLVYDANTNQVLNTNDPFLPRLPLTGGKAKRYHQANYYADGDLTILYTCRQLEGINNENLIVQTSVDMDRDAAAEMVREIPKIALIFALPILLISFLISLFITKRTMKPVKEITESAQKMSSTNLETLLPISKRNDELDQLAQTFNSLFESLRKDFERERNFTSDVSHELKTPIAGILGQARLLKRWGKDDPKQIEESLDLIITEANSMSAIITNLLQISKLENGKEEIFYENCNITSLFDRLNKEFTPINPGLQIIYNPNIDINFKCDIELLHQVLTALISNSIKFYKNKYEKEDCIIELESYLKNGQVFIIEKDNGPGFEADILPHIFERFYKGDKAHKRSQGSSGLGLAISSSIIKALGGKIQAQNRSDSNKKGAEFTIQLPS